MRANGARRIVTLYDTDNICKYLSETGPKSTIFDSKTKPWCFNHSNMWPLLELKNLTLLNGYKLFW